MADTLAPVDVLTTATPDRGDLPRTIGFWGGSAIMVGIIIGSGIFRTPTSIASQMGSPALILLLWFFGGLLSLFGAMTYAELGAMFPRSGGIYVFINEGLGSFLAFVFGWTYMLLVKPLAAAAICTVFSEYFNHLFHLSWDIRAITCTTIIVMTLINTIGVGLGAGVAIVLTGLKAGALLAIVLLAVAMSKGNVAHFHTIAAPKSFLAALGPALAAVLWTYDGWSDVASVSGEVKSPQRMLPRIFVSGTAISIFLYVAANAVYIWMIGLEEMRTVKTVAPLVMGRLIGRSGDIAVTLIVMTSTLGATHCSILTGARVTFAQARDGLLFRALGRIHPRYQTPDLSLWVQASLSCLAVVLLRDFDRLIDGFVFMMWIFYGAAAVSLIVLRIRRPDIPRAYKCFGYPFVPAIFILCSAAMTALSLWEDPRERLPWLGILLAAIPVYYLWQRSARRPQGAFPIVEIDSPGREK